MAKEGSMASDSLASTSIHDIKATVYLNPSDSLGTVRLQFILQPCNSSRILLLHNHGCIAKIQASTKIVSDSVRVGIPTLTSFSTEHTNPIPQEQKCNTRNDIQQTETSAFCSGSHYNFCNSNHELSGSSRETSDGSTPSTCSETRPNEGTVRKTQTRHVTQDPRTMTPPSSSPRVRYQSKLPISRARNHNGGRRNRISLENFRVIEGHTSITPRNDLREGLGVRSPSIQNARPSTSTPGSTDYRGPVKAVAVMSSLPRNKSSDVLSTPSKATLRTTANTVPDVSRSVPARIKREWCGPGISQCSSLLCEPLKSPCRTKKAQSPHAPTPRRSLRLTHTLTPQKTKDTVEPDAFEPCPDPEFDQDDSGFYILPSTVKPNGLINVVLIISVSMLGGVPLEMPKVLSAISLLDVRGPLSCVLAQPDNIVSHSVSDLTSLEFYPAANHDKGSGLDSQLLACSPFNRIFRPAQPSPWVLCDRLKFDVAVTARITATNTSMLLIQEMVIRVLPDENMAHETKIKYMMFLDNHSRGSSIEVEDQNGLLELIPTEEKDRDYCNSQILSISRDVAHTKMSPLLPIRLRLITSLGPTNRHHFPLARVRPYSPSNTIVQETVSIHYETCLYNVVLHHDRLAWIKSQQRSPPNDISTHLTSDHRHVGATRTVALQIEDRHVLTSIPHRSVAAFRRYTRGFITAATPNFSNILIRLFLIGGLLLATALLISRRRTQSARYGFDYSAMVDKVAEIVVERMATKCQAEDGTATSSSRHDHIVHDHGQVQQYLGTLGPGLLVRRVVDWWR